MDGIRNLKTTIILVLALLTVDVEARIRPSVRRSLQQIKTSMTSAGKNVRARVDRISYYLNSDEGSSQTETVCSAVETIGGAVSSLTSDITVEIVSGTLDVISAVSSLIPVVGPIISTVFSLIGTIFGAIGGGGSEDVGSVVRREIERALNNYDDSQLRAEANGAKRVYRISHAYLASKGGAPINEHEISALSSHVPVYQGIRFIGILAQKVRENSQSSDRDQVKRAMEYLHLYVTLAVMRSSILWEMYALVKAASNSDWTAAAIQRVIIAEEDHDKHFLKFLLEPEYSQAIFFAYFNLSEWPQTITFMEKKGLAIQRHNHLTRGSHSLRPEKWTDWYMLMYNNKYGTMIGSTTLDEQSLFYFDSISNEDNIFYMRSKKWPSWYIYMTDGDEGLCEGWEDEPGPAGEWKVIRFKDGKYMLSPRRWPNWFIYMTDDDYAYIRGCNGDPGIQGHWLID